jgi:general secretion pathway protein D
MRLLEFLRKTWAPVCVTVAIAAVTAACRPDGPRVPDIVDHINSIDLSPRFPNPPEASGRAPPGPRPTNYYGTNAPPMRRVAAGTGAGGEGYELNFDNTPVATVAKVILGDILGVGYIIDPRVQGTVTLASGRPVPKSDILFVLESALRLSSVALVRESSGAYRLVPGAEAVGSGSLDVAGNTEAGFGITVIPLQFVSAQALNKLVDGFVTKAGTIRIEPASNMVLIQGSGAERRAAADFVMTYDADWMRGQSVGIYPVRNSTPEPIISELERIMDTGDGGLGQNTVKFQSVARLNAVLVVARKPEQLRAASTWIARLDKSDASNTSVRVYRVRYGEARQLAKILNDLFIGSGGGGLDTATNQIAPGGGISMTSSAPGMGGNVSSSSLGNGPGAALGGTSATLSLPGLPIAGARTQPGAQSIDSRSAADAAAAGSSGRGTSGIGVLPGVRITADIANNSLLIYANQENYRIIERTLNQLDRPQLQVGIDATIAEVTLNSNLAYGVQYLLKSKDIGLGSDKGSLIFNPINSSPTLGAVLPAFNFIVGSQLDPRLVLDALRTVTDVKVLSTPSVVVIDNQVATLQVGDQVPVATATATVLTGTGAPVVNTIDYRNTGVILRVAPRINANGNVLLDIEQEASNVASNANATSLTPTVSQRKIKSSVSIASGQTVLLGGLISEREDRTRTGLPLLDQIPAVDDFLSRNSKTTTRTEIIIFIRPQIIRDGVDAQRVAEELRAKMGGRVRASAQRGPFRSGN